MESVDKDFALMYIRDAKDFYETLQRNGYCLPKIQCTLCSVDWMKKVMNKEVYCPLYKDIQIRPCPRPPVLRDVINELLDLEY